jgi:uncharacterized protein YjiS (DUF1127 family)
LGDIGESYIRAATRIFGKALHQYPRRGRPVHELSDWVLRDIGLEREDRMSPETRRTMTRLNGLTFW